MNKLKIEIQYSDSYKDDMMNGTSTQLFLKAGGLTIPSSSVFWVINDVNEITEGCEVSVSHDGVVSVTNGGYVCCTVKAIDKNDGSKFLMRDVIINVVLKYPELAEVIAENPDFMPVIADAVKNSSHFYNLDGLVFMLDYKSMCSAEKWTDIIGNNEFIGTNVQMQNNVPFLNGNAYYYSDLLKHYTDEYSIEVCAKLTGQGGILYREDDTKPEKNKVTIGIGTTLSSVIPSSTSGGSSYEDVYNFAFQKNMLYTIVKVPGKTYCNGVSLLASGKDGYDYNGTNRTYIGARGYGNEYSANAKIYAIRIYKGALTEEDVIKHQAIDLARFGNL